MRRLLFPAGVLAASFAAALSAPAADEKAKAEDKEWTSCSTART